MAEVHSRPFSGHFAVNKLYQTLATQWYWEKMYADVESYCKNCPQCVIVSGCGRQNRPPLHPIPVQRPFQIIGVDIMDLPATQGNKHVVVFQDFFSKWPLIFPVADQKTTTLVQLLTKEVIPLFGVPEALLSDRRTNLLSHLMHDMCAILGIEKLNTMAYHPACNGMVERFNRTLKTACVNKYADRFGCQWDRYLSGILWAYRNTPHNTTGGKVLFGTDLRAPTEAAFLPPSSVTPTDVDDYREELMLSLSSARNIATQSIQKSQQQYKKYYNNKATSTKFRVGQWVLVKFPQEESG